METNYENLYPKLASAVEIHRFDEQTFLVQQTEYGSQLRVGVLMYFLLSLSNGQRNLNDLVRLANEKLEYHIEPKEVYKAFYNSKIENLGFIETSKTIVKRSGSEYLKLSVILLKKEWLQQISWIFTPFFKPAFFWTTGAILLTALVGLGMFFWPSLNFNKTFSADNIYTIYGFLLLSTFFHEMGHISACRKFGARHGGIGFGFYLFTPVFFADVSDAWKLSPRQRVVIDMAGIYMEMIFALVMIVYAQIYNHDFALNVAFFILFHTIININPLLRYDGYWAISDLLNMPNLRLEANKMLKKTLKWIRGKNKFPLRSKMNVFLFVYGLISWAFLVVFLSSVIFNSPMSVLYYPYNLYRFFEQVITNYQSITFDWLKINVMTLLIPTFFYYMIWQLAKKHVLNWRTLLRI
jgi:putative peptide zinc metalloprotease protein